MLKFDFNFIQKLSKTIEYHQMIFNNSLKLYNWDNGLKANNFEID